MGNAIGTILSIYGLQQAFETAIDRSDDSVNLEMSDIQPDEKDGVCPIKRNLNRTEENPNLGDEKEYYMTSDEVPEETQDSKVADQDDVPNDDTVQEDSGSGLTEEEQSFKVNMQRKRQGAEIKFDETFRYDPNSKRVQLLGDGEIIVCTAQHYIWVYREYVYQKKTQFHHLQNKCKVKQRERPHFELEILVESQVNWKDSWEAAEAEKEERKRKTGRINLRLDYGIDYALVNITGAEENLKEQPILGRVRCRDPSPLRTCLTLLSDEELRLEEEGAAYRKATSLLMKGKSQSLENLPKDEDTSMSGLAKRPSQGLRRARASTNLFEIKAESERQVISGVRLTGCQSQSPLRNCWTSIGEGESKSRDRGEMG